MLPQVFHPYDPVAFRLEPLIASAHRDRRPVLIPYYKGGLRIHHQVRISNYLIAL
jgi:hypothetical protein